MDRAVAPALPGYRADGDHRGAGHRFSKIHVFHYSKRPDTKAASIAKQVQDKIKTNRVKELICVSDDVAEKFKNKLVNKKREVLFEQKKSGSWIGYSPEYILIKHRSKINLKNKIVSLKLTKQKLF